MVPPAPPRHEIATLTFSRLPLDLLLGNLKQQRGGMMRLLTALLMLCFAGLLLACERTEFEKKSEQDARDRRVVNTKPKP